MIVINVTDNIISGSLNGEVFARTYDEKVLEEMNKVADKANNASSVADYKAALEEFKKLTEFTLDGHLGTFHDDIFIDNKTGNYYLKVNGVISSVPMPQAMVDRIKDSLDKKIDISPLIKAWVRFLRNPKVRADKKSINSDFATRFFNFVNIKYKNRELASKLMEEKGYSKEVADKMATTYSMKITNEGLLAGFKVSKEITKRWRLNDKGEREQYDVYQTGKKSIDPISGLVTTEKVELLNEDRVFQPAVQGTSGDAFFCGETEGHIIRVGHVHRLSDWSKVDCDDNRSWVKGLHIGGLDYIRGYQTDGTSTHNVFVDPAHIGAIPDDSTGAIRCIQYFVSDEFSGVNGSIYHSSKYAAQTDEQWEEEKAQILKDFGTFQEELVKKNNKIKDGLNSL